MNMATPTLYPAHVIRAGQVMLGLLVVLTASLLFGAYVTPAPPRATTLDAILMFACLIQAASICFQGQGLERGISVLQTQRAPAALWRIWLRQWLLSVTRYWAVLVACTALLLATPASHTHWLAAPALLSLLQSQTTLAVLAHAGLLPRRVATVMQYPLLALALYVTMVSGIPAALAWFAALPVPVLLLCTLAWPALACWLLANKSNAPQAAHGAQTRLLRRLGNAITHWAGRYQPLREWESGVPVSPVDRRTALVAAVMQNMIVFVQLGSVQWGDDASPVRLAKLAVVCVICSTSLLVRDVHWRDLLLPGGTQLRRLGTRIVLSTLTFQAPLMLLFAVLALLLALPSAEGLPGMSAFPVVLLELVFCIALMTMVRSLPRHGQMAFLAIVFAIAAYAYVPQWLKLDVPSFTWHIGPAYIALLACATCAALAVANRRWTPQRMLSALRFA